MTTKRDINLDSGTAREKLQGQQADRLLQMPTIWNDNDFATVAARLLLVAFTAHIPVCLIQTAPPFFAVWGTLMFFMLTIGVMAWVIWNYKSKFHTAGWAMAIGTGILFAISWGRILG